LDRCSDTKTNLVFRPASVASVLLYLIVYVIMNLGAFAIVIQQSSLAAPTRPPAVLFPLGLLVLSGAMIGTTVSRRVAALIAAGALLFPLAHQSGVAAALLGGDVIFLAAFWSLARRMTRPRATEAQRHGA